MDFSRRDFLGAMALATLRIGASGETKFASIQPPANPIAAAEDEDYWAMVRESFEFSPDLVMFNHAGLSPTPKAVRLREVELAARANTGPSYVVWRTQRAALKEIRQKVADLLDTPAEQTALMMNATHGLQTIISGLKMQPGDEILTTSQDYPRTFSAMEQRERREGIRSRIIPISAFAEPDEIITKIVAALTERTKLVVVCRITYISGLIFPIQRLQAELSRRKIPLFVDGAHSLGVEDDRLSTLGVPLYCSCFHKWLNGPLGTGVLTVRPNLIPEIWPLQPADQSLDPFIEKFENVGSEPHARLLSLATAIDFHHHIGWEAKASRLEYLRRRWVAEAQEIPGVTVLGGADQKTTRLVGLIQVKGKSHLEVIRSFWEKARIHTTSMQPPEFTATRISPNIFTSPAEIDLLIRTLRSIAQEA
ncbi:MAG: aminotransferase class V-fold PLP-dependent enzyme [Fimbriimonadaceae bacterium]|jgi:selenocysteine lyase/cysteine desulfurase|nr:aminotransferase class V-fold PLP-dependent enzyme [Fimbriimonadaceae bacterium]